MDVKVPLGVPVVSGRAQGPRPKLSLFRKPSASYVEQIDQVGGRVVPILRVLAWPAARHGERLHLFHDPRIHPRLLEPDREVLSAVGLATVTLQSLSRLILVWVRGLGQAPSFVQMLAQSLLTSMERRGEEPDAAFRASFRLGCVAAVQIRQEWSAGGNL